MVLTCKICGGDITVDRLSGTATCEYCGNTQTLPQFTDQSARLLYDSGHNYLLHNEYDKAENVFNQLLSIHPQDAELHWALVLCKYGVTYVCDPATGKYVPTCNRTHFLSVMQDEHYQRALECASPETKAIYEADAQTIDSIQKGILAVSKKEKPFDVFISYKETDANGNRTKDSVEAQNLYEKLTAEGYKVFFSRVTLEDKIGTQYEPYIYAALSSSKVMLTVCSCKEHIEAPWVKNEWSRFLTLRQGDSSKTLIPLYYAMERAELPEEFAILSAQDMQTEGFEQELLRGIKKLIPLPVMLAQRRQKLRRRLLLASLIVLGVLLVATAIALPFILDYAEKDRAYTHAAALYAEGAYEEASAAFTELGDFKDSAEMAYTAEQDAQWKAPYDAAMQLYYDGAYAKALWAFRALPDYRDVLTMQETCEKTWRESVATVVTNNILSQSSYGSYYITASGLVDVFTESPGSSHEGIEFNEHGKVVSIGDGHSLMALYEDGYLLNSAEYSSSGTDFEDVIQVTPPFAETIVVLKSDGTVEHGVIGEDSWDQFLRPIEEWTNIVKLEWDLSRFGAGGVEKAVLIGLDADGGVHSVVLNNYGDAATERGVERAKAFLASLSQIKELRVLHSYGEDPINIAALDAENTLHTYIDGAEEQFENSDICAFDVYYDFTAIGTSSYQERPPEVYIVDSKRVMSMLHRDKEIMQDVVYLNKEYIVTRSGAIYSNYEDSTVAPTDCHATTQVKDVWLERR